nr:reverse transcriptase domain-containing protein [Tanacetum cinerariifolium]
MYYLHGINDVIKVTLFDVINNLKEVQNAVKEDLALNKKVIEATEAYTKNFTNLTKLLTMAKTFEFLGLITIVDFWNVDVTTQNDHLAEWVESSASMAWSSFSIPSSSVPTTTLAITEASTKVHSEPDTQVLVPYEIHGKMYQLTEEEIQAHLDKEEKLEKAARKERLRNGDPPVPDLRTMEELCQPSLNGRGGPIAPISIQAMNFRLKNDMIQQVQNSCQFHGLLGDDANKHLDKFLHVTQSIKVNEVTDDALHLYIFPHSLTHHATAWFDRLPRNSINTFQQIAKMFLGKYFPPSMVTKLRNEITNSCQRPDESLFEAWERYKLSINRCPNHNMLPVTQIDTFYNGLTLRHRDTINAAAEINKNLMRVLQVNQQVKAVTPSCETCGGPHSYNDCPTTVGQTQNVYATGAYQGSNSYQPQGNRNLLSYRSDNYLEPPGGTTKEETNSSKELVMVQTHLQLIKHRLIKPPGYQASVPQPQVVTTAKFTNYMKANDAINKIMQTNMTSLTNFNLELKNMFGQFMKMNTASSLGSRTLPGNTITNPKEDLKGITTRSGTAYQGPTIPTTSSSLPKLVKRETEVTKDTVPFTNNRSTKNVQPLVVQIETPVPNAEPVVAPIIEPVVALVNALILMPKFGPSTKSLLTNKDKLYKLARTPLNEHCSAVLLKKLPEKLWDPVKFLIPCDFPGMDECLAQADLGASINLMPLSVWNKLSLPQLTPTLMTLELVDRSISQPIGVAEYVFVKVGKFHFSADFVVVDFDADPRVPLILRRSFLKTRKALIDVYEGELTLRVGKEAITFNLDQTSRYSANYNDMTANRIDVIDMACEEYSQEVLGFSDVVVSEVDAFLALEDDPTSPEVNHSYFNPEGDILLLEAFFSDDPSLPPPNQGNYLPQVQKELKSSVQHQRRVNPKIHNVIKKEVLKLLDVGLIYPISDSPWEKSHFMVKEGIVLGHKISKNGIEVDKAKVDVIAKFPHPTTVNGIRSFLGHASFYRRFIQDFSKIVRPMTRLLEKDTLFFFSKECVESF